MPAAILGAIRHAATQALHARLAEPQILRAARSRGEVSGRRAARR